jgi:hypothetical protein
MKNKINKKETKERTKEKRKQKTENKNRKKKKQKRKKIEKRDSPHLIGPARTTRGMRRPGRCIGFAAIPARAA